MKVLNTWWPHSAYVVTFLLPNVKNSRYRPLVFVRNFRGCKYELRGQLVSEARNFFENVGLRDRNVPRKMGGIPRWKSPRCRALRGTYQKMRGLLPVSSLQFPHIYKLYLEQKEIISRLERALKLKDEENTRLLVEVKSLRSRAEMVETMSTNTSLDMNSGSSQAVEHLRMDFEVESEIWFMRRYRGRSARCFLTVDIPSFQSFHGNWFLLIPGADVHGYGDNMTVYISLRPGFYEVCVFLKYCVHAVDRVIHILYNKGL